MDRRTSAAVQWLLACDEPAVRRLTTRDVLGRRVAKPAEELLAGAWMRSLLAGQQADGGFGGDPYRKWTGAHWRLVALSELDAPPVPAVCAVADRVLSWLAGARRQVTLVNGLPLSHATMEGNALGACSRLGLAGDPRAAKLASWLTAWQWPDGGWNCDRRATGRRSSFHESLAAAWGLHEYGQATGDRAATQAAARAAELFLDHRVFRTLRTGEVIDRRWLQLRYPSYWHYDILQALLVLSRMGLARDPRAGDALDELERRRLPDGRWPVQGAYWRLDGTITPEVVDWGRTGPNLMVTLNALRVLRAAGRLTTR